MNEVFRKRLTGDYLDWFEKRIEEAQNQMAGKTAEEWSSELSLPEGSDDTDVLTHFVLERLVVFGCDYNDYKDDPRVEPPDWGDGYIMAEEILKSCSMRHKGGRDLKNHVACIRARDVSSKKANMMPKHMYGNRAGNKSWNS
jgi:hypothetical protein|tara:strand:+ start:956 stop:1381 length:426 start_codon:yes stop_codon:yes gene_type:complete